MNRRLTISLSILTIVSFAIAQQTTSTSNSQSQNGSASASSSSHGSASSNGSQSANGSGSGSGFAARSKPTHAVIWVPGDKWEDDKSTQEQPMFKEHNEYLLSLCRVGKNIMSGPWRDEPGGLTLLRVATDKEAESIIENDPMVKAGVLSAEARAWTVTMESTAVSLPLRPSK